MHVCVCVLSLLAKEKEIENKENSKASLGAINYRDTQKVDLTCINLYTYDQPFSLLFIICIYLYSYIVIPSSYSSSSSLSFLHLPLSLSLFLILPSSYLLPSSSYPRCVCFVFIFNN